MVVGEISQERELIIIGGGPGGYSAAIRGAQLGLTVTLIEQAHIGGVCLNKGCIPSKVFSHAAVKLSETAHLRELGIEGNDATFNIHKLISYKTKVVERLRVGVENLCKQNNVELIHGNAAFLSLDRIGVENGHQFDIFEFKQVIIATGSSPMPPTDITMKGERILGPHEIYELEEVPTHLIVVGHDYIALEAASSYAALGSKVSLVIDKKTGLPFDESINKELNRLFKKRKISVSHAVELISKNETDDGIALTFHTDKNKEETIQGSHLFFSGSRKPNVEALGIKRFGIELTTDEFIKVDENMQSSIPSIYAIGDVTEGPLLAVKAIKQGKAAVEVIAGGKPEVDVTFLPTVVHTIPPVASVGLTEQCALASGFAIRVSHFSLKSNGYATITDKNDGFIKVISNSTTDIILGIHMVGEGAIEMSGSFVQLLEMAAKEEDIKFPLYAHPSLNEGLLESVEELIGQAIHVAPDRSVKKDLLTI